MLPSYYNVNFHKLFCGTSLSDNILKFNLNRTFQTLMPPLYFSGICMVNYFFLPDDAADADGSGGLDADPGRGEAEG